MHKLPIESDSRPATTIASHSNCDRLSFHFISLLIVRTYRYQISYILYCVIQARSMTKHTERNNNTRLKKRTRIKEFLCHKLTTNKLFFIFFFNFCFCFSFCFCFCLVLFCFVLFFFF